MFPTIAAAQSATGPVTHDLLATPSQTSSASGVSKP